MDRLAKVSSFLGIPPVCVGVSVLALDRRRVDVTTVLPQIASLASIRWVPANCPSFCGGISKSLARSGLVVATNHLGILSSGHAGRIGVLLIENLLVGVLGREVGSSLDGRKSSSGRETVTQGRSPHDSLREHLKRRNWSVSVVEIPVINWAGSFQLTLSQLTASGRQLLSWVGQMLSTTILSLSSL